MHIHGPIGTDGLTHLWHIQNFMDTYTKSDIYDVVQGYQVGRNIVRPLVPMNNGKFVSLVQGEIDPTSNAPAIDPGLRINIDHGGDDMWRLFLLMEVSEGFQYKYWSAEQSPMKFSNGLRRQISGIWVVTFRISNTDNKTRRPRCTTTLLMIPETTTITTTVTAARILQTR
jgi:hypothetical protein